jgi:hypothetical protein
VELTVVLVSAEYAIPDSNKNTNTKYFIYKHIRHYKIHT